MAWMRAALLHPYLTLFGGHPPPFYGLGGRGARVGPRRARSGCRGDASRYARLRVRHRPRRRVARLRSALVCLCAVLALGGAVAAPALAASELGVGGSFDELDQSAQEQGETTTTNTSTTASTSTESTGTSSGTLILVALGAVALLSVVGFVIVRDARRVAPATDADGSTKADRDAAARLRKRRAKAKAARKQRKRKR